MQTFITIAPIFILIALGWGAFRTGFLPHEVLNPLNRLIYYFAIPAFLFHAISNFPLTQGFNIRVTLVTLGTAFSFYSSGWLMLKFSRIKEQKAGVLVQGSCHGNLGYIGLPVAFYFLGSPGLAQAGIISGFLMILQNIMSVTILQSFSSRDTQSKKTSTLVKLLQNPVILSSMAGIIASGLQLPVPEVVDRTLKMLGQLAPPAALLLIGASLSFKSLKSQIIFIAAAVTSKLVLLPAAGLLFFTLLGIPSTEYLPALILLSTPTATVAYVMARQMNADLDIAVALISISTLLSALTLPLWLSLTAG